MCIINDIQLYTCVINVNFLYIHINVYSIYVLILFKYIWNKYTCVFVCLSFSGTGSFEKTYMYICT